MWLPFHESLYSGRWFVVCSGLWNVSVHLDALNSLYVQNRSHMLFSVISRALQRLPNSGGVWAGSAGFELGIWHTEVALSRNLCLDFRCTVKPKENALPSCLWPFQLGFSKSKPTSPRKSSGLKVEAGRSSKKSAHCRITAKHTAYPEWHLASGQGHCKEQRQHRR
jgi:hypothetical protein